MTRAGIALLVVALAASSTTARAAPASIKDLENMPAKQVFEYCAPLWKRWDRIADLETAEQQDTAARCFF
jgi:hypothetical protein